MCKEIYEKNEKQESSDTLPFHWEFGKEEITLKVSSYASVSYTHLSGSLESRCVHV